MAASVVPGGGSTRSSYSDDDDDDDDDAEKEKEKEGKEDRPPFSDGEALQSLFARHCDSGGLMTREDVRGVPEIATMLVRALSIRRFLVCLALALAPPLPPHVSFFHFLLSP